MRKSTSKEGQEPWERGSLWGGRKWQEKNETQKRMTAKVGKGRKTQRSQGEEKGKKQT